MKSFYKIIINYFFKLIYGDISILNGNEKYRHINITYLKFYKKKLKLYSIENGRVFTDCNTNVAYISKNKKEQIRPPCT